MAVNEPSEAIGVDELRLLEQSVLKALCLTINTAGSELKYKILDSLSDEDFYFPVNKSVFQTLSEMHLRGDYVISANLEEELRKSAASLPTGFSIERLFEGQLPSLTELNVWVGRIRERSRSGMVPSVQGPSSRSEPASSPSIGGVSSTVVRSVDEVKKKIADAARKSGPGGLSDSSSSSSPPAAAVPSPAPTPAPVAPVPKPVPPPSPAPKPVPKPTSSPAVAKSSPGAASPRSSPAVPSSSRERSAPASFPDVSTPRPVKKAVLSSEGDDWGDYLDDLASKQGKTFDTGFKKLDDGLGGLSPGLMLLVDEQRERILSFLKQLTDQFAQGTPMRCLYLTTELQKTQLRIRTLGRLAGVNVKDIEKGRLKRDSPEWQRIEAAGKRASEWLKRVFVYEVEGELDLPFARELVKKLLESSKESTCTMVVDALEKVGRRGGSSSIVVSQLKALASSMDILIVAATSDPTLLGSKDADYAGVFREGAGGLVELEVLQTGQESSVVTTLRYQPDICGFAET